MTKSGRTSHVRNDASLTTFGAAPAKLARTAVRLQTVPDRHLPDAGVRAAAGVPHLSAWPRRLAGVHRHHHRAPRSFRRPGELPVFAERSAVVERGVLQRVLYGGGHFRKIRARFLAGAAA